MSASHPPTGRKRLDSWKEIAAFFGRDERTVNRWEKELGLPVHRLPGTKGRVYAFAEELAAWLASPRNAGADPRDDDSASQTGVGNSGLTIITGRRTSADTEPLATAAVESAIVPSAGRYRNTITLSAAATLVASALVLVFFRPSASRTKTAGSSSLPHQTAPATVLASTPAHDPEAEQLYLKGRYY